MVLNTRLERDDERARLFALYESVSAREIAATCNLRYPGRSLSHETYMELVDAFRVIRTEGNHNRLAIGAHRKKMEAHSRNEHNAAILNPLPKNYRVMER